MAEWTTDDSYDPDQPQPSKTQRKREMQALQDLGKQLTELNLEQRAPFNLPPELEAAIADYQRFNKREAKRRQLQFIGRLMRSVDPSHIRAVFAQRDAERSRATKLHHLIEQWRDRLLDNNPSDVTTFLEEYPQTDTQQFRQLVRNAVREQQKQQPPKYQRQLFRFLREVILAG